MYYIGISAYYHESSVFLTDNERTNCFLKEESFSRIKGDKNFPKRCLNFLIEKFDLKEGKLLGSILKEIEEQWLNNNFKISYNQIEDIVKSKRI